MYALNGEHYSTTKFLPYFRNGTHLFQKIQDENGGKKGYI